MVKGFPLCLTAAYCMGARLFPFYLVGVGIREGSREGISRLKKGGCLLEVFS